LIEIAGKKNFNTCADLVLEIEWEQFIFV
jgi:hypothetical protein